MTGLSITTKLVYPYYFNDYVFFLNSPYTPCFIFALFFSQDLFQ